MKKYICILPLLALAACSSDTPPTVNLGIDDVYYIPRMSKLALKPALTGNEYLWAVDGVPVSTEHDYIFLAKDEGSYNVSFDIIDHDTPFHFDFIVEVMHEDVEYSPYISKVYEYCPAPGQFINEMPRYEEGDTYADIITKVEESISGTNDVLISLGAYGGYVTFGFDHTVVNVEGAKDLRIWGNCFYEHTDPSHPGGSAEPGIVMVSYDTNCNGLPDDTWYELAGSEYHSTGTRHGYTIRYHRPDPGNEAEGDASGNLNDKHYIAWDDSDGGSGYIARNMFHQQDYYPKWVDAATLSFTGSRLASNGVDSNGNGSHYILYSYPWGYVDNHPNDYADLNSFDIGNAVDDNGNPVNLPGADFIRVYTGVNQSCGWLGETSTEISRAQDLHIDIPSIQNP